MRPKITSGFQRGNVVKDRKSTRLNSSHANISYAVFCLKKKKNQQIHRNMHQAKIQVVLELGRLSPSGAAYDAVFLHVPEVVRYSELAKTVVPLMDLTLI